MKTFKFSNIQNTDVFITLDDNIYGIHSKRVNILYITLVTWSQAMYQVLWMFPDLSNYTMQASYVIL